MNVAELQVDGDIREPRPPPSPPPHISLEWQLGATEGSWILIESRGHISSACCPCAGQCTAQF